MNWTEFLQNYLAKPEAAGAESKNAAGEFLSQPVDNSPVKVNPGKALPEEVKEVEEPNKSVGQTAKESILPKVRKVADTKERVTKVLGAAVPDISEAPVPSGGIGLLVFISLIVVFAITPIKGKTGATRLQLLWGTILGNYSIKGNSGASPKSSSSSSSGAPSDNSSDFWSSVLQGSAT